MKIDSPDRKSLFKFCIPCLRQFWLCKISIKSRLHLTDQQKIFVPDGSFICLQNENKSIAPGLTTNKDVYQCAPAKFQWQSLFQILSDCFRMQTNNCLRQKTLIVLGLGVHNWGVNPGKGTLTSVVCLPKRTLGSQVLLAQAFAKCRNSSRKVTCCLSRLLVFLFWLWIGRKKKCFVCSTHEIKTNICLLR